MVIRQIIQFFITYKYLAIFPIAVVEGPIITIISGFLVSRGRLELFPVLFVVFLGDVVSDLAYYFLGRGSRHMTKLLKFFHISDEKIQRLEKQFESSPWKTMIVAKMSYGLGSIFMIASGASRMSLKKFIEYIASLNFVRSSVLLSIGYYFGRAALHMGPTYLKYYTFAVIVLIPTSYYVYRKRFKRYL